MSNRTKVILAIVAVLFGYGYAVIVMNPRMSGVGVGYMVAGIALLAWLIWPLVRRLLKL